MFSFRFFLTLVLLLFCANAGRAANYTATANGSWTNSATWSPAGIPGIADLADVAATSLVTNDVNNSAACDTFNLEGTLVNNGTFLNNNNMNNAGAMKMGTNSVWLVKGNPQATVVGFDATNNVPNTIVFTNCTNPFIPAGLVYYNLTMAYTAGAPFIPNSLKVKNTLTMANTTTWFFQGTTAYCSANNFVMSGTNNSIDLSGGDFFVTNSLVLGTAGTTNGGSILDGSTTGSNNATNVTLHPASSIQMNGTWNIGGAFTNNGVLRMSGTVNGSSPTNGPQGTIGMDTSITKAVALAGFGVNGVGSLTNSAGQTASGAIYLVGDSSIGGNNASTLVLSGVVSGSKRFIKVGTGTVNLSPALNTTPETYTGDTVINGGTLIVTHAGAGMTNPINSAGSLVFGGGNGYCGSGTFQMNTPGTAAVFTQTVAGVSVLLGGNTITTSLGAGSSNQLFMNAISRASGGGTLDFNQAGGVISIYRTTTTTNAIGHYGGALTWAGTDWLTTTNASSPYGVKPYAAYATGGSSSPAVWTVNSNLTFAANPSANLGTAVSVGSLRFTAATTITWGSSGTMSVGTNGTGGILVQNGITANLDASGSGSRFLQAQNGGGELVFAIFGTGILNISSGSSAVVIQDNGGATAVTKSGAGYLLLKAQETYTGKTMIHQGTVAMVGTPTNTPAIYVGLGATLGLASGTANSTTFGTNAATPCSISGSGTITNGVILGTNVTVYPGGTNLYGTLSFNNGLTMSSNVGATVVTMDLDTISGQGDLINVTGAFNPGGARLVVNPGTNFGVGRYLLVTGSITPAGSFQTSITFSSGAGTAVVVTNGNNLLLDVTSFAYCTPATPFGMTGGTNCSTAATSIGLNNSQTGYTYQLFTNGVSVGTTGSTNPVAAGAFTFPTTFNTPATYTMWGTNNAGGCAAQMTNNVVITTAPVGGTVAALASAVCNGNGTFLTNYNSSGTIIWQSRTGSNPFADVAGAPNTVSLSTGNLTTTTDFRARLTNSACSDSLSTTSTVTVATAPATFTVTGGTNCASNGGVTVGLSGSVNGVTYQLFTNGISTGTTGSQAGTGAALNFGAKTTVANYTIWGTNGTGCSALMSGGAAVYNLTATVSGGGAIRRGQTATITNTLSGTAPFNVTWSDGVTSNGVSSPLLRTVSPTAATTYTITNLTDANCSTNGGFTGSAAFTVGTAYKILTSAIAVAAGTSTNITVTLVDSAGATISGFNGAVNFTFSGLSASAYGSNATVSGVNLGSTTAVTLTSGVSTNLPLKAYHYSPSTQTLVVQDDASPTANASTNTGGAGASVTVTSGAVSSLAWLTQPGGAVYGSAFGTKPILATVDQFGVPSTTGLPATLNVAVRLASGTGTLLGTTNYNMGTTGSNGVVTFQDLQINSTGSKTLAMDMRPVTNSAVWLDGSDTNTIVGSSPVTGWLDKSGNGVSFTNTIGSVGTITYANTLNGRKVVTFPGNSPNSSTGGKGLTNGNYTFTGNSTHMFVVVRHTAGGYATGQNWLGPISSANGTNADWNVTTSWSIDCNNNANGQARTQRNSAGFGTGVDLPADGTTFLIEAGHDFAGNVQAIGVKATNQNNYATFAPGFAGAFNLTKLSVGCRFDPNATGGGFWNGDIGEVIIYHTYLSAADRGSVEFYATNKWINPSFATPNTAAFTVAAATPTQLVFSNAPSTTPAGATMTSVTVQMLDAAGQPVSSAGTNITVALTSGSGTLLGTLTQATAANGQATFNNLSMTNSGAKQLQASAAGLTSTPNASFTINPAAANKLVFVQGPSAVLSGAAISPAMTVQLQDQYGNNRSDAGTNVTITVASGTITLSGTTTIASDSTGLATFSNVIPNGSTQSPTLQASAAPLTAAVSGSFLVTAVNIDLLTFTTQPASTNAGQTMAEVAVTATYLGSPVTNVPITLVLTNSTGTLLGTVNRTTDVNGVAHYTDLSMTNAGVKQLRATATTNAAASATFTISALMGTKLGFMTQPASTNAGQVVAPPVAVQVQDTYGNNVSSNGVSVGLTLGGSGTLSGTTTRNTDGSGAATFNDLSVNLAGNKTLSAAASGLTGATSSSFTISNAGATKLGIVTNAPSNATAYVAFTNSPTVVLQDQFGNTASNSGVAVYVTTSAGTLQGTTTNNTGADGRAVFSGLSLTNSGSVTLTFNSTGLTSTNTTAITVVALPPLSRVSNTSLTNMPVTPPVYGYTLTVFTNNAGANLSTPDIIGFASPPGETNRLFYIRKTGYVMVITNLASPNTTVFLDLTGKSLVSATGTGEGGLLGLAFHPGYASNGQFYVFYLGTDNTTSFGGGNGTHDIIARYTNSPGANTAVLASEQKLIRQYDRKDNHNGGDMHFGPDGICMFRSATRASAPATRKPTTGITASSSPTIISAPSCGWTWTRKPAMSNPTSPMPPSSPTHPDWPTTPCRRTTHSLAAQVSTATISAPRKCARKCIASASAIRGASRSTTSAACSISATWAGPTMRRLT